MEALAFSYLGVVGALALSHTCLVGALALSYIAFDHASQVFNWTSPDRMQPFASYVIRGRRTQHMAFGDHNLVNGKIWPSVQVERK